MSRADSNSGPADPAGSESGPGLQRGETDTVKALRMLVDAPEPQIEQALTVLAVALERHLRARDDERHVTGSHDPLLVAAAGRYSRLPDTVVDIQLQLVWAEYAVLGNQQLHGADDPRSLEALHWLACLLDAGGQPVSAEHLYLQAADGYRRCDEPLMVLRVHNDLAGNLHRRGHCGLARDLAATTWDTWRREHRDAPEVGELILFCAIVALHGCGDLGAVETLRQQAADVGITVPAAAKYGISDDGLAALLHEHRAVCQRRGPPR